MTLISIGISGLIIGYEIYQMKKSREDLKDILKDYYEYGRPVDKSVFHDLRDRMKRQILSPQGLLFFTYPFIFSITKFAYSITERSMCLCID